MTGILHLQRVAKLSKNRETPFEGMLGKAIRECTDNERGRDVPLEDFCYDVVSFWRIREDVFLARFANVNDKGKPFGNMSIVQTLFDVTLPMLKSKMTVYQSGENPRYDHFYNPRTFADVDYLWCPDSNFCHTLVATYRR